MVTIWDWVTGETSDVRRVHIHTANCFCPWTSAASMHHFDTLWQLINLIATIQDSSRFDHLPCVVGNNRIVTAHNPNFFDLLKSSIQCRSSAAKYCRRAWHYQHKGLLKELHVNPNHRFLVAKIAIRGNRATHTHANNVCKSAIYAVSCI